MNNTVDSSTFCADTFQIWQFAGEIVTILKILIPVILVILGVVSLSKALLEEDTKEIKTATTKLIKKVITGICIFFIPTIIAGIFNLVDSFSDVAYTRCIDCIASPKTDACTIGSEN